MHSPACQAANHVSLSGSVTHLLTRRHDFVTPGMFTHMHAHTHNVTSVEFLEKACQEIPASRGPCEPSLGFHRQADPSPAFLSLSTKASML